MITLYSYPELLGLPDNNPYGLKVYAFLRLCDLPFAHAHLFDAGRAPRGQLPDIEDDGRIVGDSDRRPVTRQGGRLPGSARRDGSARSGSVPGLAPAEWHTASCTARWRRRHMKLDYMDQ
jgi:hypothetical protein